MPARELQTQLETLRAQLEQNPPLSEVEREDLPKLMEEIEAQIKLDAAVQDTSLRSRSSDAGRQLSQHCAELGEYGDLSPSARNAPLRWRGAVLVSVGASLLANGVRTPRTFRKSASSLTFFASKLAPTDAPTDDSATAALQCCGKD